MKHREQQVVADLVEDVRLVKTAYEIGRTVHACSIVNEGHRKLLEITRPGGMEILIYGEVVREMMGKTLMEIPLANLIVSRFIGAVWPPSLSHDPHIVPTPVTTMEEGGPHVSIVTAQVDGYGVEVERTFFLGRVPEQARRLFDTVMKARALAYELVKPGAVLEEIDRKVRQVLIDAGYECTGFSTAPDMGLGITGHEAPYVALGDSRDALCRECSSASNRVSISPARGVTAIPIPFWLRRPGDVRLSDAPDTLEGLTIAL